MSFMDARTMPFGGWIGTVGVFVGAFWGFDIGGGVGLVVGIVIGAVIGSAVEHVLAKVLIIGLALFFLLIRHGILQAIFS